MDGHGPGWFPGSGVILGLFWRSGTCGLRARNATVSRIKEH